ncbi:MAG TPA: peptide chain release factor 1 [Flavobacteriales bacterium]|jgi:peptide chain release factor 1|nr:peptide chain release factor 1 [Flavobacteriales bacterium]
MLDKLLLIEDRFSEVSKMIVDPDIISDMNRYVKLNKEYKDLEVIVNKTREYKNVIENIKTNEQLISSEEDDELKEMAAEELDVLRPEQEKLEEELKILLIPKDPEDEKNAVVEIRAGTGGDEASLFAGDLYRMYARFCDKKGWKLEMVSTSEGTVGGFKEIIFNVTGVNVYGELKYEAGVHRVQRIPQTETQGRVHTSASTVMVLPEVDEFDVEINEKDIRKDLFCASGPGGQSVNTTYSAVRLTHLPTGMVVQCQDQKSQHRNYEKALAVLRSRIYDMELQKRNEEDAQKRKLMVSSGDRSAKIRTYNYPQGRVTDHRINLTLYNLSAILDGDIEKIIEELKIADNAEKMKEGADT